MSVFDDLVTNAEKLTAHKAASAVLTKPVTPCISAPVSFSLKSELNPKKGEITSYLAVYNDPTTGMPYLDSYQDYTEPGFMSKSIAQLNQARKRTNDPYLMLYLWQHNKNEIIGGVKDISEDSQGYFYVAQVNMKVQRGREAFALAEAKQIGGSSYGYDPQKFFFDEKKNRHLVEVDVLETSLVSFPANPYATVVDAKSRYNTPQLASRIAVLADKMNASFDELERQFKSMHSAFPEFDWLKDADEYPGEIGLGITDLLVSIQKEMKR